MEKKDTIISVPTSLSSTSTMEIDNIHSMGSKIQIPTENITELIDYEHTSNEKVITTSESNSFESIIHKPSKSNLDAESEPMTVSCLLDEANRVVSSLRTRKNLFFKFGWNNKFSQIFFHP
jgi:hypothetical protein